MVVLFIFAFNMKKKIPQLKYVDGELKVENDFTFEISSHYYTEKNLVPFKKISFLWCMEIFQMPEIPEDEKMEVLAEKLKQDFLKFVKEQ